MPVLAHPLEEIGRNIGFQSPCTKLLIHLLVLLRQWKITFSIHQSSLFAAEFNLTQAAVVFSSLCELYLDKQLRSIPRSSDSSSKQFSFFYASSVFKGPSPFICSQPFEENDSSHIQDDSTSFPTFFSEATKALVDSLLETFSKRLGHGPTNPSSSGLNSRSLGTVSSNSSADPFSSSSLISPLSTTPSSITFPPAPYYPSNPTPNSSTSVQGFSPSTSLPILTGFDCTPSEDVIQLIILQVQRLAEVLKKDFFGPSNGEQTNFRPIIDHPTVKKIIHKFGGKTINAKDFPSFIQLLKSEVQRINLNTSALHTYLHFFSQHPHLPLLSISLPSINTLLLPEHVRGFPAHQAELLDFWWLQSRFDSFQSFPVIAINLSEYLKETDPMAYALWNFYKAPTSSGIRTSDGLWRPEDLLIDVSHPLSIKDLAQVFPCDSLHGTTIGDWVLWRLLGWLYLCLEIENKIYAMRKKVPLAEHERSVSLIQNAMNQLRCKFGYTRELHQRLSFLYLKLIYRTYPMFSPRFHQALRFLGRIYSQIVEILSKPFLHASDSHSWTQVWELVRHTIQQWVHLFNITIPSDALQENRRIGDCAHMIHQVVQQAKPLGPRFLINPLFISLSTSGYFWMHLNVRTTPFSIAPTTSRLILDPLSLNKICQAMSLTHPHIELIYGVTVLNGHWNLVTEASTPLDIFSKTNVATPSKRLELACHLLSAGWVLFCAGLYIQSRIHWILVNDIPKIQISDLNYWISADHDNSILTSQPNPEIYFRFLLQILFCNEPGKVMPEFKPLVQDLTRIWMERLNLPGQDRDGSYFFRYAGECIMRYNLPSFETSNVNVETENVPQQEIQKKHPTTEASTLPVHIGDQKTNGETVSGSAANPNLETTMAPLEAKMNGISLKVKTTELTHEPSETFPSLVTNTPFIPPIALSATHPETSTSFVASDTSEPSHHYSSHLNLTFSSSSSSTSAAASSVTSSSSFSSPVSGTLLSTSSYSPRIMPTVPEGIPRKSNIYIEPSHHPSNSHAHHLSPQSFKSSKSTTRHSRSASISNPPSIDNVLPRLTPTTSASTKVASDSFSITWKKALQIYREGQGDLVAAFLLFKEVAVQYPMAYFYMAESFYFGSEVHGFQQDPPQAYTYYETALNSNCLIAHVGLGDCTYFGFGRARDLTTAQHHYMQTLKLTPIPPKLRARAWAGLGDCQFDMGDYATALDAYLNAVQLDPTNTSKSQPSKRAYARLAWMHIHGQGVQKNLEKAKSFLKQARLCRREVLVKSEWFRAVGEPQKADSYLEEYLWRFPIDY